MTQVALNDTVMVFAFAPIVGLLLGLSAITIPWSTLFLSVVLYIVTPVLIAQAVRKRVLGSGGQAALSALLARVQPLSLIALLTTLMLLFGFQGRQILEQPLVIAMLAMPILIQVYFNAGLAYVLNRSLGSSIASPVPRHLSAPATSSSWRWRQPLVCSASTQARHSQQSLVCWWRFPSCYLSFTL
jgi:arsenite transporter